MKEKITRRVLGIFAVITVLYLQGSIVLAGPIYGPYPNNAASGELIPDQGYSLPDVPTGAVPTPGSPGFSGPNNGVPGNASPGSGAQPNNLPNNPGPVNPNAPQNGTNNPSQPISNAPTFMNNAMPNSSNPFLPNNISPGLLSAPLENAYLQQGVPQLAAPMMSAVYRPFGLTFFQPNPFQVTPQGTVTLTGIYGEESNINFTPSQTEWGSFFGITPAVLYSNFDDYGYISLFGSISYFQYNTANTPPFLDEIGGVSAGTYLGTRVFVGAQDFGYFGETPGMNGSPLGFLTGINPYYGNMADAEIGIALTPKITFVQGASDMYFDDSGYGAGLMNIQSLTDTLNYADRVNLLSISYNYQQGIISLFPSFISNGLMATAMRQLSPTTSFGVGGNASYFLYEQSQSPPSFFAPNQYSLDFYMYSYYGILTHRLTPSLSVSVQGGWNGFQFFSGQSFQAPMIDLNIAYTGPRLGLGLNVGEYMANMSSYGVEMGPEKTKSALGYLTYSLSRKTSFFSSAGYTYYDFLVPYGYSNNFFQTLQPNLSYSGSYLELTDGLNYSPLSWVSTSLTYNLIDFSTNVPNETIVDNIFLATVSFIWAFK